MNKYVSEVIRKKKPLTINFYGSEVNFESFKIYLQKNIDHNLNYCFINNEKLKESFESQQMDEHKQEIQSNKILNQLNTFVEKNPDIGAINVYMIGGKDGSGGEVYDEATLKAMAQNTIKETINKGNTIAISLPKENEDDSFNSLLQYCAQDKEIELIDSFEKLSIFVKNFLEQRK